MSALPELEPRLLAIARAIEEAGGRALLVGGTVRDHVLGRGSGRDVDVEVLGLAPDAVEAVLTRFGPVSRFGRIHTVLHVGGLAVEFTVEEAAPGDFARASLRRDLTMNSMAIDPLSGELLDPHGGRVDLAHRRMRATDPAHFGHDPLRALRVARFAACLELEPDAELVALCARQDLGSVAGERMLEELRRMLVEATRPARGLATLERCDLLPVFPELDALRGVEQDPAWHPEGDVWTHTMMVVDVAAGLRTGDDDFALMLGALCHDLGKPSTTALERARIRSLGHDRAGIAPTRALLGRLRASNALVEAVCALVEHHLAPALFVRQDAGPRGYRRLARKLETAGVSMELLARVARADHLGRTTEEALAGLFPAGDTFLARAAALALEQHGPRDVVLGRHVVARGVAPGPAVGRVLEACRAVQDETGETDPERILDRVLG